MPERTIIPIAGGKGGVGKTFVTASLAIALARQCGDVVACDLDLGNSNLHSFLGLENRYAGIGDFLRGAVDKRLDQILVRTEVPGLRFLPGDGRMPFMANLTYNQKRVLIRELKRLETKYLLLDLSAGTSFNTLDFFSIAGSGILVTTPEYPAIVSMLVFIKNMVLRVIDQELRKDPSLMDLLNEIAVQRIDDAVFTVDALSARLKNANPEAHAAVERLCRSIRPRIAYNMLDKASDLAIFAGLDRTLDEILGIACDHIGLIPYDGAVRQALRNPKGLPLRSVSPQTQDAFERLARRIVRYWAEPIEGSAELLAAYGRTLLPNGAAAPPEAP